MDFTIFSSVHVKEAVLPKMADKQSVKMANSMYKRSVLALPIWYF